MNQKKKYEKTGELSFYRGTSQLKGGFYSSRQARGKMLEEWLKSVKNLNTTENYYIVIKPKV